MAMMMLLLFALVSSSLLLLCHLYTVSYNDMCESTVLMTNNAFIPELYNMCQCLPAALPTSPPDVACSQKGGVCIDICQFKTACQKGALYSGLCAGSGSRRCCVPKPAGIANAGVSGQSATNSGSQGKNGGNSGSHGNNGGNEGGKDKGKTN